MKNHIVGIIIGCGILMCMGGIFVLSLISVKNTRMVNACAYDWVCSDTLSQSQLHQIEVLRRQDKDRILLLEQIRNNK